MRRRINKAIEQQPAALLARGNYFNFDIALKQDIPLDGIAPNTISQLQEAGQQVINTHQDQIKILCEHLTQER